MNSCIRTVGTRCFGIVLVALAMFALFPSMQQTSFAQGSLYFSTGLTGNTTTSSNSFITFNVTPTRGIRVHRIRNSFASTGTTLVDIWGHPGGVLNANVGWVFLGQATVNVANTGAYVEIPVTLNLFLPPNQTYGFLISHTSISVKYTSGAATSFTNADMNINLTGLCAGTGTGDPLTGITNFSFSLCTRQWCGGLTYDYAAQSPNDAALISLDSPKDFCAGDHPVIVTLENAGTAALTSATINWQINGVLQTPYAWTGMLDTLNMTTRRTQVTLTPSYTFTAGVPYHITAWTTMPNGVTDTVNFNDSVDVTRQAALSGTFTIGGSSPDFLTLTDAATTLNANGICGPVILNMRDGTYNEQVTFAEISGASATNTITLQSESGIAANVTISASGSSAAYHTLLLSGTDWMRVRNLTILGTNPSYGRIVSLLNGASNNVIEHNTIWCATGATSSSCTPIYMYNLTTNSYNTFDGNDLRYGYYGAYLYGSGSTSLVPGTRFINNMIRDIYYYGLSSYYQDAPEIVGNTIQVSNTTLYYGMYLYYNQNQINVSKNRIIVSGPSGTCYGLYPYYCTAISGSEGNITNNFVSISRGSSSVYGLRPYYSNYQNIDFNTIDVTSTTSSSYAMYTYGTSNVRMTNNIFYMNGPGYAAYSGTTGTTFRDVDYNVYWTNGATLAYWNGSARADLAALRAATGDDLNSIQTQITFADRSTGDLHLAGASQNDVSLTGMLQSNVTEDIDADPRVVPYRGADEACYILPNTVTYRLVDGELNPATYATVPGTVNVQLNVAFPDMGFPLQATVNFYTVPANTLAYSTTFNATKLAGQPLSNVYFVAVPPTLTPGYYRVNIVLNTQNSCGNYIDYMPGDVGMLFVGQGQTPCIVWPGDVNNDGIVNYGDRSALNKYIFNANLQASWLQGPARYRADYLTNPMTYFTWEGQAGAPWATPEGCYMDADGNGMVNNFDQLAVKLNFYRTHGTTPKNDRDAAAETFSLTQNYPNPFNPSTTLQYSVPERSTIKLVVSDMLGRTVAVLVDDVQDPGTRTITFDAAGLESGVYMARIDATGIASGLSYSRTIKMTLSK